MYGLIVLVIILILLGLILLKIGKVSEDKECSFSSFISSFIGSVCLIVAIVLIAVTIIRPFEIKETKFKIEQTQMLINSAVFNGTDYENTGITKKIIETNEQLANIKASVEAYGILSYWYGSDVDTIPYLKISFKE